MNVSFFVTRSKSLLHTTLRNLWFSASSLTVVTKNYSLTGNRDVASVKKKGVGGDPEKSGVYKACTAENFRNIGVKSTVLELQKT